MRSAKTSSRPPPPLRRASGSSTSAVSEPISASRYACAHANRFSATLRGRCSDVRVRRCARSASILSCLAGGRALVPRPGPASAASGWRACDTALVRSLVQPTLPEFSVMTVRAEDGIVTLLLARRNDVGTLAVALRASGSKLFTEVMSAQLGETELARASETIGSWYYNEAVREALGRCNPQGGDDAVEQSDQPL